MKTVEEFLNEAKDNMNIGQNRYSIDLGRGNGGNFYISVDLDKSGKVFMTFKNDRNVDMSAATIMMRSKLKTKGSATQSKALKSAITLAAKRGQDIIKVLKDVTGYKDWDIDDGSDIVTREDG